VFVDSADKRRDLIFVAGRREISETDGLWSVRDTRHQPQATDQTNQLLTINVVTLSHFYLLEAK